jgi:hypothetical protein
MESISETSDPQEKETRIMSISDVLVGKTHKELLRQIIDAPPKQYFSTDDMEEMSLVEIISHVKSECGVLLTSEDDVEIFRALHQIRHISTQALLAHVRRELDDAAVAA